MLKAIKNRRGRSALLRRFAVSIKFIEKRYYRFLFLQDLFYDLYHMVSAQAEVLEQVQHEILEAPVATYNFEVEGFHTYYVGENDIFVHNKCFRGRLKDLTKYTDEMAEGFDAHHVFPQKFADEFSKIGVKYDNAKFGSWVDEGIHRGFSHEYNLDWDTFLHSVDGKLPTKSQTMKFGRMLAKKYGFDILF